MELPSIVDGICLDIVGWEGSKNMTVVETSVMRIVREVAEECKLPLEGDKEN